MSTVTQDVRSTGRKLVPIDFGDTPTIDLTEVARVGGFSGPSPFDRDPEYSAFFDRVYRAVHRRDPRHLLIVRERGVGEHAVLAEIARRAVAKRPTFLATSRIIKVDCRHIPVEELKATATALFGRRAGTEDVILCVDGFGSLLRNSGFVDNRSNVLALLSRTNVRVVGLLSPHEFEELISADAEVREIFSSVQLHEPQQAIAGKLVRCFAAGLSERYSVHIDDRVIDRAISLSSSCILHERLPSKAVKAPLGPLKPVPDVRVWLFSRDEEVERFVSRGEERVDVAFLDEMNGSSDYGSKTLAPLIAQKHGHPPIVIVSHHVASTSGIARGMEQGQNTIWLWAEKDKVNSGDTSYARFLATLVVSRAEVADKQEQLVRLSRHADHLEIRAHGPVAESASMKLAWDRVRHAAKFDVDVLIMGESGTGKGVLARQIHELSPRHNKPFIPVNCAAMPESLAESQLFGHVKGAFTSATESTIGFFGAADGGTILLDEIGAMPIHVQAKLLHVLQERTIWPIGAPNSKPIDVRVIAATNSDLRSLIEAKEFRDDLYYRLKKVEIILSPLRERQEDIPSLIDRFLEKYNQQHGRRLKGPGPVLLRKLQRLTWPGNVRQLENTIENAVVMSSGDEFKEDFLPSDILSSLSSAASPRVKLTENDLYSGIAGVGVLASAVDADQAKAALLYIAQRLTGTAQKQYPSEIESEVAIPVLLTFVHLLSARDMTQDEAGATGGARKKAADKRDRVHHAYCAIFKSNSATRQAHKALTRFCRDRMLFDDPDRADSWSAIRRVAHGLWEWVFRHDASTRTEFDRVKQLLDARE